MGQFPAAKQFAHVCAGGFVVKLYGPASGLMHSYRGGGLASFGIGVCFESRSRHSVLFLPSASIQFLNEISQVLAVSEIEEQFVFNCFPFGEGACDLQRRIPKALQSAFTV